MENKISSLTNLQPLNPNTLPEEVAKAISFLTNYYENVDKYPVRSQVEPGYLQQITPENAPTLPESLEKILKDVETNIIPGLTHWQSPNFFAHFPASISNAALVGDILCSGINVVGFNWISSPAATELESIVTEWMAKLLNLPNDFHFSGGGGGVIHGTTCEAVVCTLAAARDRALNVVGEEKIGKLVVYASDQTHFCFQKAAKIVGILPRNFRVIPTCISKEFALSPDDLKSAIEADVKLGLVPMYICASVGATASTSVDPIKGLGLVAQAYGAWLHVDAAYAGNACICPEYRHYFDGLEFADSFSLNLHKWLLTTLECCCLWLKNPKLLVNSLSTDAEVLRNKATDLGNVIDYKDWQIALTRRFRALKLWVIIRRHGSSNLMSHIRSDIELSKYFETLIEKDERFELVVPRKFALVCFRLRPVDRDGKGNVMNQKFLEAVNSSGKAYMTHAVLGGMFVIRCSIGGTLTSKVHVDGLWALLQEKASFMLMGFGHCFKTKLQENISTLISLK